MRQKLKQILSEGLISGDEYLTILGMPFSEQVKIVKAILDAEIKKCETIIKNHDNRNERTN